MFLSGKNDNFITNKNTIFVSMPLTAIKKKIKINNDLLEKVCFYKFENNLRANKYHKRVIINAYTYHLLMSALFKEKIILDHIIKRIKELKISKLI